MECVKNEKNDVSNWMAGYIQWVLDPGSLSDDARKRTKALYGKKNGTSKDKNGESPEGDKAPDTAA